MRNKKFRAIAIKSFALLVVLGTAYKAMAQDAKPTGQRAELQQVFSRITLGAGAR